MNNKRLSRTTIAISALLIAVMLIVLMHFTLPTAASVFLLDIETADLPYPLTIQNIMWVMFVLGMGEVIYRYCESRASSFHLKENYLPDDDVSILQENDLAPIFKRVKESAADEPAYLPRLIHQAILQFHSSKSIDRSSSLVTSQLDLFSHQLDLRYSMIRYLVWFIPTLGFIGTVYGIALALDISPSEVGAEPDLIAITTRLGVAFNTTLLALLQSAILVYFMHIVQGKEERALNLSGQMCMNNLINRLYVKG